MKEVFLLGFIVCWTVLCNSAEGYHVSHTDKNEETDVLDDSLTSLLEKEYLFFSPEKSKQNSDTPCGDNTDGCTDDEICIDGKCVVEVCSEKKPCKPQEQCVENQCINTPCGDNTDGCTDDEICIDGKCVEKCNEEKDCMNGGTCEGDDGEKTCKCLEGLSGDFCDIIDACATKTLKYCKDTNGTCSYNVEKKEAFCLCPVGKDLHPDNVCKEKCTEDKDCKHDAKCDGKDDTKFCQCETGLSGDKCETVDACATGMFKLCKGVNGNCSYDVKKRAAVCSCPVGKSLHPDNVCKDCNCGVNGTCSFEGKQKKCTCDVTFAEKTGICVEKCTEDKDCKHDAKCDGKDDTKFCQCETGLSGDKCETVDACATGMFKLCKGVNGNCSYDVKKRAAVCSCPVGKSLHPDNVCKDCNCGVNGTCSFEGKQKKCTCDVTFAEKTGICVEKCTEDKDCKHDAKCDGKDDTKFCQCETGLSGDKCETVDACATGMFKLCKGVNGNCSYDVKKRAAVCSCPVGKSLHPDNVCKDCNCGVNGTCSFEGKQKKCTCEVTFAEKNGICVETCTENKDCKHDGKCDGEEGKKFCQCETGLSGDKCETVDACATGIFKFCKGVNGNCSYNVEKRAAVCSCPAGKALDTDNLCKECNCGKNGTCKLKDGLKECICNPKFVVKNGICEECDCGENGLCTFNSKGEKECKCHPKFEVKGGICEDCYCGDEGKCSFDVSGKKKCVCNLKFTLKDEVCTACDCGDNGRCSFDEEGGKQCNCTSKYANKNGTCTTCDCGENGNCRFDNVGNKTCDCKKNFQDKNGLCTICDCGDKGVCSFEKNGNKKCVCEEKYADKDGICSECDCGKNGLCVFNTKGEKECKCHHKFEVKGGICEDCYCGDEGKCSFDDSGKKKCDCNQKFSLKGEMCTACDCGDKGRCSFDEEGGKQCNCTSKYANKNGICTRCDCGEGGSCSFVEGKKTCHCIDKYELYNNDQCIECDCGDKGECTLNDKGQKTCTCHGSTAVKGGKCVETCTVDGDCDNGAKCEGKVEGKRFCDCKTYFLGDRCETIKDCSESGKYKNCVESGGICGFDGTKAYCNCTDEGKKLDNVHNICREMCKKPTDCENGADCVDELCVCNPGTSGDKCNAIDCSQLKCKEIGAKCVYDKVNKKATCECNDTNYVYEDNTCVARWCKDNCDKQKSTCEFKDGTGSCICKNKEERYDYSDNNCKSIDKCLLETTCKENEICKNGACVCHPDYEKKKEEGETEAKCRPKQFCVPSPCFGGANCSESSPARIVKCLCEVDNLFYSPKTRKCEDGSCFLPGQKGNCKICPNGMTFKDGGCNPTDDAKKCNKDCGSLGWCMKTTEGKEECTCHHIFGKKVEDKCVLNAKDVCPDGKVSDNDKNKCNCTGIYKYSKNKVTCEKRSCSDDDVQKECKSKGAICVDNWKSSTAVYSCICPDNYGRAVEGGHCLDPCGLKAAKSECSKNGQVCYLGENNNGDCRCPPTFVLSTVGDKKTCDATGTFTYMLKELPVIRKNYNKQDNSIDKLKLSVDVIKSMKQTFKNLEFAHVFDHKTENDVLVCNVWLQFKADPVSEIKRWKSQLFKKENVNNAVVLPPGLLLSPGRTEQVKDEKLTLCSASVKQAVCGQGAGCDKDKCFCESGFRIIESTVQILGEKTIMRCEDIDECKEGNHQCTANNTCVNTLGDYYCKCKAGHKKNEGEADAMDKTACSGLCHPNPCLKGTCQVTKDYKVDCTCDPGHSGSLCNRPDMYLQKAQHSTTVVGAVLGTFLAVIVVLIVVYVVRQRKKSYSEDFTPAPRLDNAEMSERRPMRGVTNRAFQ